MTSASSKRSENKSKKDGKQKEEKKSKPMTKVIVRRLPPKLKVEEFVEAISPIPDNDYFRFVAADESLGLHAFSQAYLNFVQPEDVFLFKEKFDGYVFVDKAGKQIKTSALSCVSFS